MSTVISPSELTPASGLALNVDLVKARAKYENNGKSIIAMANFRLKKSPFKIRLEGELSTDGINVQSFGDGKNAKVNYSFGFITTCPEDLDGLAKFQALVDETAPDDYESVPLLKEEVIYIKLKTKDGKRFNCFSNIKLEPKKVHEAPLYNGQPVAVTAEVSAWFNVEDKKAGVSLSVTKLEFSVEEEEEVSRPLSKKVKV